MYSQWLGSLAFTIQGEREISAIIVTQDYLCYKEPKSSFTPVVKSLSYSPLDPRFAGSIPAEVDGFFQNIKILSMTSFGREVKP